MKKAFVALLLLALTSMSLMAQIPSGYYNNANGKTGSELKVALHNIIKGHHKVSYAGLLNAFVYTDCDANNKIWDIYSNYRYELTDNGESFSQEGQGWNREHTWPQSWFNGEEMPRCDLFHVYPTDGYVNSQRSNYPYGEVNNPIYTSGNGSKLGPCVTAGYAGRVFEPVDEYKGDIARSYFYMSVRYYSEDDEWASSEMTNKSEIQSWAMSMLLRWSDEDPVSAKEIARNNAVYGYQNNRNPFIDHPEYARMIWDPNWQSGGGGYEKVTSSDQLTDGEYLIVYETGGVALDGALTTLDASGNTINVTIVDGAIASSSETNAATFTIAARAGGGYSIKSASGYYIGNTSNNNALKSSTTVEYANSIGFSNGNADIVSSSTHLRYNTGGNRFRYYQSSTYTNQQAIQLYKKREAYIITCSNVEYGSIMASFQEAAEGTVVTLTATPDTGYDLDAWVVTDSDNLPVEVTGNQFVMPASNVTVSASFVYVGAPFVQHYHLVTSADQLVAGRTYLIVNTNAGKAMGTSSSNGNNRTAVDVTIADNVISSLGNSCELTLGSDGNYWTLFDANWGTSGGYLYAASSSSNYLKTQASYDDNGKWSISFASNGVATIQAQGTYTRNVIKYNSGNNPPIFSCYSSSNNNMQNICLFIRSEEYNHTQNETIARIFPFDKHTVQSGVTLTVTGSVECTNASHLVLEDGAQLVHTGNNVQATVKKTVAAYSGDGGWYTIAVPFAAYTPTGTMVDNDYDLYAYDEDGDSNGKEWINYKAGAFNLVQGQGYLYAHNPGTTLRMEGTLNSGNYSQVVNLCYASNNADLRGFNLLGNPTAHSISYTKTTGVSDGYYYLSNNESWVYAPSNTVPAGRGFMVKANASTQRVTLNPQSKDSSEDGQYLCFSIGEKKAYVKLNEGVSMPLLSLKGEQASLYLTRDGKRYVMLVRNGASTLDLGYVSQGNGMQTLEADLGGLDINYLHLIDNLTGADVDLLQTPQYSFNATADDPGCRFRLAFSSSSSASSQTDFAYFDGSEWVIKTDGDAILQVVDMMGRVVVSRNVTNRFSTRGIAPGVYFMRLINDSNVRTQKIVVK